MSKKKYQWMQCINFRWKLYQRSGTWYADGRPNRGRYSLATNDERDARQRVTELDRKIAQRLQNKAEEEPAGKAKPTGIHEGWERYIEHGNRPTFLGGHSPATTKKYREMQRRSTEYFKSQDILWWFQLKPKHLTDFAKAFEKKLSPRSIHHEITMHASVCNWLIREELLDQKFKLKTDLQKPEGSEAFCYTEKQVTAILEYCRSQRSLQQMGLFCHLLSHTGLRLGEAISLKWRDIDFDQGFLTVRDERFASQPSSNRRRVKNGSTRRVPLAKSVREQLLKCKSRRSNAWVFPNRTGGPLMANNLRDKFVKDVIKPLTKRFEEAGEGEEMEEGRFHSFRHYFVSQCFLKGINEGTIRSWVGHRDSKIVELYRHLAVADSKRLMEQLEFTGEGSES
jgi:integrase